MSSQEKLQKLFDAALKDNSELSKAPAQAFPKQASLEAVIPMTVPMPQHASPVVQVVMVNAEGLPIQAHGVQPMHAQVAPLQAVALGESQAAPVAAVPAPNLGLDEATSTELGLLLDDQRARLHRKRVRDTLIALACCLALTGGGVGWFVSSPARTQALSSAIKEIRSAGDIKGLLAAYQKSLDRIAKRGGQIDKATVALGSDPTATLADPNMDAEMKEMMGGEGKTMGDRDKALRSGIIGKFAQQAVKKVEAPAPIAAPSAAARTVPGSRKPTPAVAQVAAEDDFSLEP